jgi:CDP-4-dehydro-6-deoxyglucose reductase
MTIARLIESREAGPDVRHFVFEAPELPVLAFRPGQFVSFNTEINGRKVTRAYSIASAPDGNRFELCLNRVREGLFSPHLFAMQPGGEVRMTGPLGYFVPRTPFRDSVFVATGTGIAPFRSFLLSKEIDLANHRVTLLFGARYEAGLLYRGFFEKLSAEHQNFRFLPTITRPEPNWNGRTGWVQEHLDEALAGRTNVDVYICGLKAMVDAVRSLLRARGFERDQVVYEKYD